MQIEFSIAGQTEEDETEDGETEDDGNQTETGDRTTETAQPVRTTTRSNKSFLHVMRNC